MICKQLLVLFLWCHCYQILLNPLLQILAVGLNFGSDFKQAVGMPDSRLATGLFAVSGTTTPNFAAAEDKVALTPGQSIALKCDIAGYPDARFTWLKARRFPLGRDQQSSDERKELNQNDDRYTISKNEIIIKSSTLADVGDYFCQVKDLLDGVSETEKMISVRPKPLIRDFELQSSTLRSAIVEEGMSLTIPCHVVDEFFPSEQINLTWYMSKYDESDMNLVVPGEDGISVNVHNKTSQDLIIDRITKDHRRIYKCLASNGVTENSKAILIRVKDKYIVIWPAVGIVIELVILIGVIIVVENRKVEPDKGAYDLKAIQM